MQYSDKSDQLSEMAAIIKRFSGLTKCTLEIYFPSLLNISTEYVLTEHDPLQSSLPYTRRSHWAFVTSSVNP